MNITSIMLIPFLLLVIATPIPVACFQQNEKRIDEAVAMFRKNQYQEAMTRFREIGSPAIPAVLTLLRSDDDLHGPPLFMLIGFISLTQGQQADAALIELLADKRPFLRGQAANLLGCRKVKSAVPDLIRLLTDKEVHKTHTYTDPYREENILVRDAAIQALESITEKRLAKGKNKEEQAKAWIRWWGQQNKS